MSRAGCARERSWWKCKPNRKLPATPSASNALSSSLVSEFFAPSPGLHAQLILAMSSGTIHKARCSDFLQATHWADCVFFGYNSVCSHDSPQIGILRQFVPNERTQYRNILSHFSLPCPPMLLLTTLSWNLVQVSRDVVQRSGCNCILINEK